MFRIAKVIQIGIKILNEKSYFNIRTSKLKRYIFIQNQYYSNNNKINLPTIDSKRKGFPEKKHKVKNKAKKRTFPILKLTAYTFGISTICLGVYTVVMLGRQEEDIDGKLINDDVCNRNLFMQYLIRTYRELCYYIQFLESPAKEKLLPDHLDYPYMQPKYTLVLELVDVLVHPEWAYNKGWRFKKRPLLDHFLDMLKRSYEIVIYTPEQGRIVFPLIEVIDPRNIIAYKLVHGTTYYNGRNHVKKLENLNRDLSKVICIDWNAKSVKYNSENLLKVKRWTGNANDTSLFDLAILLNTIADNDIEDVRDVLKYYSKYPDPVEAFRMKQEKLIDELDEKAAAKKPVSIRHILGLGFK